MTDTTDNRALVDRLTIWAQSGLHEGVYKKALSDMRLAADALTAMLAEAREEGRREVLRELAQCFAPFPELMSREYQQGVVDANEQFHDAILALIAATPEGQARQL